ncbi:MAG: hypothetical protein AAF745_15720 [Planctomycetota bacterium]
MSDPANEPQTAGDQDNQVIVAKHRWTQNPLGVTSVVLGVLALLFSWKVIGSLLGVTDAWNAAPSGTEADAINGIALMFSAIGFLLFGLIAFGASVCMALIGMVLGAIGLLKTPRWPGAVGFFCCLSVLVAWVMVIAQ